MSDWSVDIHGDAGIVATLDAILEILREIRDRLPQPVEEEVKRD